MIEELATTDGGECIVGDGEIPAFGAGDGSGAGEVIATSRAVHGGWGGE